MGNFLSFIKGTEPYGKASEKVLLISMKFYQAYFDVFFDHI